MSGSPDSKSVHFARGTHFRTKSQNPIKRSRKKLNFSSSPMDDHKTLSKNFESKSPNWKKHREEEKR